MDGTNIIMFFAGMFIGNIIYRLGKDIIKKHLAKKEKSESGFDTLGLDNTNLPTDELLDLAVEVFTSACWTLTNDGMEIKEVIDLCSERMSKINSEIRFIIINNYDVIITYRNGSRVINVN